MIKTKTLAILSIALIFAALLIGITSASKGFSEDELIPVYRGYNAYTYDHIYTINKTEANSWEKACFGNWNEACITQFSEETYHWEGIQFYVFEEKAHEDLVPMYRLWSEEYQDTGLTASEQEKDYAIGTGKYKLVGIEGYVFTEEKDYSTKLLRAYHISFSDHIYTTDREELDKGISDFLEKFGETYYEEESGIWVSQYNGYDDDDDDDKKTVGETFCEPIWDCGGWSDCYDGIMQRNCIDTNKCEYSYNKPTETMSCSSSVNSSSKTSESSSAWLMVQVLVALILITLLLILFNWK